MLIASVAVVALRVAAARPRGGPRAAAGNDWLRFGWSAARSSAPTFATGITAANVRSGSSASRSSSTARRTRRRSISTACRWAAARTTCSSSRRRTARPSRSTPRTASVLWRFTPPGYSSWAGSAQITTATPVADPGRTAIYAASPDGKIYKLAIADGHPLWSATITKLPSREKIAASLNYANGHVIATTGGYIGDAPPYQGHVALLDPASGKVSRSGTRSAATAMRSSSLRAAPRATRRSGGVREPSSIPRPASCSSRPATRPGTGTRTGATPCSCSTRARRS